MKEDREKLTPDRYDGIVRRLIEAFGHSSQSLGLGRVLGQVFAHVYLSKEPQSLDDITNALGISKGSASMSVRQLERWHALEKTGGEDQRRSYYRVGEAFGPIVKNSLFDITKEHIERSRRCLKDAEEYLASPSSANGNADAAEAKFLRARIATLRRFQDRMQNIWDDALLRMLLK